jgi:hypothetical protein
LRRLKPDISVAFIDQVLPITSTPDREHFLSGLAAAGLTSR